MIDQEYIVRATKHVVKGVIGRSDPTWPLFEFEHSIHPQTIAQHYEILATAEKQLIDKDAFEHPARYLHSNDPIVRQGFELKTTAERRFRNKRADFKQIRILLHVPDQLISPAHYSLFSNFAESFNFLGVPARAMSWGENLAVVLEQFKPSVFIALDHPAYLKGVDWGVLERYRKTSGIQIGLSTYLEGEDGSPPLIPRLEVAKKHHVDFYYTFRDMEYVEANEKYRAFAEYGFKILSFPFGVNPLHYYPVPDIDRDVNYVMLASISWHKGPHYVALAKRIVSHYPGFIDGYGWKHTPHWNLSRDRDRYIYARGKTGLNFHIPIQTEYACEVNERTHQLAACGIPQIVDEAKLLPKLYSSDAFFVTSNGRDFFDYFARILRDPAYGQARALVAQREAFERHTTFHRCDAFIEQLLEL